MAITFELVETNVAGRALHGLWRKEPSNGKTAIHVHGTWGNFYGNPFIEPLAEAYGKLGVNYLTVNVPGHDETAVSERFEDFVPAIDSWIERFATSGGLILQGHSLGALKILSYLSDARARHKNRVEAVVLLSPFDIVAFYASGDPSRIDSTIGELRQLEHAGGAEAPVPTKIFSMWPIAARTMRELMTPGGEADQFPSRSAITASSLTRLKVPIFVAIGGADFAAYPSPQSVVAQLEKIANTRAVLVAEAPHNFAGHTEHLANALRSWLQSGKK